MPEGVTLYADDDDRESFLGVLGSVVAPFNWRIHAWVLMDGVAARSSAGRSIMMSPNMNCPHCRAPTVEGEERCRECGHDITSGGPTLVRDSETLVRDSGTEETRPRDLGEWRKRSRESRVLPSGFQIGQRYEVRRLLGHGGMGTVYQVFDRELDRDVALKMISDEHADSDTLLQRFKREIQLSSIVTHPNVLRVYDLGESAGVKYLTMQCVEGEDLGSILRSKSMPLDEALPIFRQICHGMAAAHEQGVIHRDLKPENVIIDQRGHAYVTDFGLARSAEQSKLTATGAIFGTPDYMSPEQVTGKEVDHRSDIFALGVILFRMLSGRLPYDGQTTYENLVRRAKEKAPSVRDFDPKIPERIVQVIERSLAIDPKDRYQSIQDLLHDLGEERAPAPGPAKRRALLWSIIAAAVLLGVVLAGVLVSRTDEGAAPVEPASPDPMSVLVADVENRTGDPIFDGTLEPILTIGLEGAPFITSYNRGRAREGAEELRPGDDLDAAVARLVALREGVEVVVAGSLTQEQSSFKLTSRAIYTSSGEVLGSADATASNREQVLEATTNVAQKLRGLLGDATAEEMEAAERETFTSSSLEAAQKYAQGQELQWQGKYEEAIERYREAVELDPSMGRAYAGMAAMYANIGDREKAEQHYRLALQNLDRMTERERFRTRGGYYLLTRNQDKALEEFTALALQYPSDTAALNNLALAHFYRREMDRALERGRKPVEIYPKNVLYRNNLALYAMYAGDFETAIEQAGKVLEINPEFVKAYVARALSEAAIGDLEKAGEDYEKLERVSDRGASLASIGKADLAMLRGDPASALSILESGIESDEKAGNESAALRKRLMLAEALARTDRCDDAVESAASAIRGVENENLLFLAASVFVTCGDHDQASAIVEQLEQSLTSEPRLYAKLIEAESLLHRERPRGALEVLGEAQEIADSWLGRLLRGRAYNDLGAHTEASSELDLAAKRSGEAVALLLDDVPTAHYLAYLEAERERARQGLTAPAARESFATYGATAAPRKTSR